MTARNTLLFTALAAAMFAATPAFAQDTPPDTTTETDASVPKDRLVDAYSDTLFAGDDIAAGEAVTALRTGGSLTVTITEQAKNPDGTPSVDANGKPVMVTRETILANPNGPMGWGEVDHSLGIAQALVEADANGELTYDEALFGTAQLNADGTPVLDADGNPVYSGGILQLRAEGMGWGQIAKELGFKSLGEIKSGRYADADSKEGTAAVASDKSAKGKETAKTAGESRGKSAEHKSDRAAKADRVTGKSEKVERIAKVDRPAKIDRPERPSKPERGRP